MVYIVYHDYTQAFSYACTKGASRSTIFLIWAIHVNLRTLLGEAGGTLQVGLRRIAWSLEAMQRGKWPTHDEFGKKIRDSKAAIVYCTSYEEVFSSVRSRV